MAGRLDEAHRDAAGMVARLVIGRRHAHDLDAQRDLDGVGRQQQPQQMGLAAPTGRGS